MRCKKLTGMGSVAGALQHCYRERETPNADADRTPENEHRAATSTDEAMGELRRMLPEKRRKDAVLAVEYVMTASPEWWKQATPQQQAEFFRRSEQWIAQKYGGDRIVTSTIHRDEATPHLSVFVVPLTRDGRLSAKEFIGSRHRMRADQTSYAEAVRSLGLERGIEGSRATHQTVRRYYESVNKIDRMPESVLPEDLEPRVLRRGLFTQHVEDHDAVAKRVNKTVRERLAGTVAMAFQSAQNARKADELRKTMSVLQKRLRKFTEAFEGLSSEQMNALFNMAAQFREKNRAEQRQKSEQTARKNGGR